MGVIIKDLGAVTAYAYAVIGGYVGTEAEFEALLGNIAEDLSNIENLQVIANGLPAGSSPTASYSDGVLTLGIPKGDKGDTGDGIAHVNISTLPEGSSATASYNAATETLSLGIPVGATGATGNGIQSIYKTGTTGNVDEYTILYTDGNTDTFTVTNGNVSSVAGKTGAVTLDADDVAYDETDTYSEGTVGEAITNVNGALTNKLDKTVYKNELTQTTTAANSWVNYPYAFKAGEKYIFYNLSSTATMYAYTRSTANIDQIGTIAPNSFIEFTATANAEYVRVNATKMSETFKVVCVTSISEEISALKAQKLDASIYSHTVTGTCQTAGTYYNFPYHIVSGRTYKCYATTEGDTISLYTRLTESGSNADVCGPIAYGSEKSFKATSNAEFVRVITYLNNGTFLVVEDGTINERLNALEPSTPILNLPKTIYAVTGKELNIYFDNICEDSEKYRFDVTCTKGSQMERGYQFTPSDDDAGTYTLTIDVYLDENIIATAETSLVVSTANKGSGETVSFIIMGDSTVNGTDTQIVNDFSGDVMSVTSKGTRGTSPALHEGRTGWTFQYYYNSVEIGGISNAFYNPSTHLFDANYYFSNSGVTAPDWFLIQLGINDVFLSASDKEVISKLNSCITQCNAMISSLKSAVAGIKIGIAITIPPNKSQDAFGKAYGCGQTRSRYKRNNLMFASKLIDIYDNREDENIYIVPIFMNLDTTYNMGLESTPVNARNTITYESPIANGSVHPVESGYKQLADVYMAFFKALI